jgi:polyisoprenyl-phosphate glycosyltransferase
MQVPGKRPASERLTSDPAEPRGITLSIVIPVYNEGDGLLLLADRLRGFLSGLAESTETIFVDDHSTDHSPNVLQSICAGNPAFRWIRLSRNSGSHVAILAGLEQASGRCAVFMAADLQDPPELIAQMLDVWRQGNNTVWAVRAERQGVGLVDRLFARAYYWLMNHFADVTFPPDGADFALIDRSVISALLDSVGANTSVLGEIATLGFRQANVLYTKEERKHGTTKWSLRKKLKLFADSFVSFSYAPIRGMSYLGMLSSVVGVLGATYILVLHLVVGHPVQGWASLMVVVLALGGMQMLMLGVLGEYLWRTLDESRRRPRYFLEEPSAERRDGDGTRENIEVS